MHVHRGAYSAVDDGTTSIQDHGRQLLHGICSASDTAALTRVIATEEPYRAASLHSQRWDTRSRRGARTVPTRRGHPRVLRRCQLRHCGHELRVVQSPTRRELHTTDTSQSSAPHTSHTQTLAHVYQDVTSHAHTRRQRNAVQHPHRSPTAMTACSGGEPTYAREDDVHFRRRHKPVDHLRRFAVPRVMHAHSRDRRAPTAPPHGFSGVGASVATAARRGRHHGFQRAQQAAVIVGDNLATQRATARRLRHHRTCTSSISTMRMKETRQTDGTGPDPPHTATSREHATMP
jgi:hypothetical protein